MFLPVLALAQFVGWSDGEEAAVGSVSVLSCVGWAPRFGGGGLVITDSLLAFWKMEESGNSTRYDAVHSYNLQHTGSEWSPTRGSGKIGYAADFEASTTISQLWSESTAFIFSAGMPFTLACWVNVESWTGIYYVGILGRYNPYRGNREYCLALDCNIRKFDFRVADSGTQTYYPAQSDATLGQWHCLVGWYNPDTDSTYLSVDGAAPVKTACPVAPGVKTNDFIVGYIEGATSLVQKFDGLIDCAGVWRGRCPQSGDGWKMVSEIYNSGNGWEP